MSKLEKLQKYLIAAIVLLAVTAAVGIVLLLSKPRQAETAETGETLSGPVRLYPDNLRLFRPLTTHSFTDAQGNPAALSDYLGEQWTLCLFWGSWCSYCEEQMELLLPMAEEIAQSGGKVLLIDKMDPEKESPQAAAQAIADKQIPFDWVMDTDMAVYQALGLHVIPTAFFLDRSGNVVFCHAGVIHTRQELEAMVQYTLQGAAAQTEAFLRSTLLTEDGAVHLRVYGSGDPSPSGRDVLAESQGLLMEYAAETGDRALFGQLYSYVEQSLDVNGLLAWYASGEDKGSVNALLDDLRVLRALKSMGGCEDEVTRRAQALIAGNLTSAGNLVDFYTFSDGAQADRLTMCYCDWDALEILADQTPEAAAAVRNAEALVEGAYLGDAFPFYANYYDYGKRAYDTGSLNMTEAMLTLLHQARAGRLPDASLRWLRDKMAGDGIRARYDIHGNVTADGDYEASATYAIVGLIALELKDDALLTQALSRMEFFRCFRLNDPLDGAFADTLDKVNAFDQCMALVLYGKIAERE